MSEYEDVCALVPTRNEAATIADVVDGLYDVGVGHVLVVDGNSGDETPKIAEEHGAEVVQQTGDGKGQAVRQGVDRIDESYVLLLDGDGTNPPEQAHACSTHSSPGTPSTSSATARRTCDRAR